MLFSVVSILAQENGTFCLDTIQTDTANSATRFARFSSSKAFAITRIGVPLIATGLIVKGENKNFRHLRNDYIPNYKHRADNVLQYSPAMIMLTMKACGVKGRSSWGRMLVSDVFSCVAMAGIVNALKYTTHVERPDGSNDKSFPSGRTATAFMTATMLQKEYGHLSPWIGVCSYSLATTTGVMRIANNKHWLRDVLCGAGIGVVSTELGYFLTDLIFKGKGIYKTSKTYTFGKYDKPSFIGLYMGMNFSLSPYYINNGLELQTFTGSVAGIEGAGFINPYIGFGGRCTVSNTPLNTNSTDDYDDSFKTSCGLAGVNFSFPVLDKLSFGTKAVAGVAHYSDVSLEECYMPSRTSFAIGSGVSMQYRVKGHYGVRLFLDYNAMPSLSELSDKWTHSLTLGLSAAVLVFRER